MANLKNTRKIKLFLATWSSDGLALTTGCWNLLGAPAHLYDWHFSTYCEYFALPWLDLLPLSLPFSSNYETQNLSPKVQRVVNIFCFPCPALIQMQSHAQLLPWHVFIHDSSRKNKSATSYKLSGKGPLTSALREFASGNALASKCE